MYRGYSIGISKRFSKGCALMISKWMCVFWSFSLGFIECSLLIVLSCWVQLQYSTVVLGCHHASSVMDKLRRSLIEMGSKIFAPMKKRPDSLLALVCATIIMWSKSSHKTGTVHDVWSHWLTLVTTFSFLVGGCNRCTRRHVLMIVVCFWGWV